MLVHFLYDDKFPEMALREFEHAAPGGNVAIILGPATELKHVKSHPVQFMGLGAALEVVHQPTCDAVIFHSLLGEFQKVLQKLPAHVKAIWLGWGYDYYDRLLSKAYPNGLLLAQSASLRRKLKRVRGLRGIVDRAKSPARRLRLRLRDRATLPRIDIFSPVLQSEYELACSLNGWFRPKYVRWNYGTLEDDFEPEQRGVPPGNDILVGNSASYENNHLEAFELLRDSFQIEDRRIIVPLSYGDPEYASRVIEAGKLAFDDRFIPITDFLDKTDYIRLLDSCGFVMMNHLRQQALGNIYIMMLKGARVFLHSTNPLYTWLVSQGATLDRLDEPHRGHRRGLAPLTAEQRITNRAIVEGIIGRDSQRARTRNLVTLALQRG